MEYSVARTDSLTSSLVATECKKRAPFPETPFFEGDGNVLKKVGVVAVAAIGLSLAAAPAIASAQADVVDVPIAIASDDSPSFGDAYNTFILGGGALGYGAAALVAGAYTGIATTPALIASSFDED